MRMNIGIGRFYCFQKRNPQPATFFENHFFNVGGVREVWKRQVHFWVGLPFVYSVVYFSIIIVVYFSITIYRGYYYYYIIEKGEYYT